MVEVPRCQGARNITKTRVARSVGMAQETEPFRYGVHGVTVNFTRYKCGGGNTTKPFIAQALDTGKSNKSYTPHHQILKPQSSQHHQMSKKGSKSE